MEYMRPPITLCVNGHNICDICKPRMVLCPICRAQFLNTRNKCVEDLVSHVKYPCKYRASGCKKILNYDTIVEHQVKCRYSPQVCPVVNLVHEHCSWTGSYNGIKGHLKEEHLDKCIEYDEGGIQFICRMASLKYPARFLFAYNEIFFFSFIEKDNIFYFVLLYVGPAENAAKYKHKVEFVNP